MKIIPKADVTIKYRNSVKKKHKWIATYLGQQYEMSLRPMDEDFIFKPEPTTVIKGMLKAAFQLFGEKKELILQSHPNLAKANSKTN